MKNQIEKLTFEKMPQAIEDMFNEIIEIKSLLNDIKQNFQPKEPTEFLTRTETAKLFKCDLSTIWKWTQKGKLKPYGIGNRVYYKRSDIENAAISIRNN